MKHNRHREKEILTKIGAAHSSPDRETELNQHPGAPRLFSAYCGLTTADLPQHADLEEAALSRIIKAWREMLLSWGIATDIPAQLPATVAWPLYLSLLDAELLIDPWSRITWSFCRARPDTCIYGAYCPCADPGWSTAEEEAAAWHSGLLATAHHDYYP